MKARRVSMAVLLTAGLWSGGAWAETGAAVFAGNCALCHQFGATGLPGQFPRLAGRFARIASTAPGRDYLIKVMSFGMAGTITVDGQTIAGAMPAFRNVLSPSATAAVADYLQTLQSKTAAPPFQPAAIARVRAGVAMTPAQVLALRKTLGAKGMIP